MTIIMLKAENLTHLGGPMGSESVSTHYEKPFTTREKAMAFAEQEYGQPIEWAQDDEYDILTSGDLGWVMYTIYETEVE